MQSWRVIPPGLSETCNKLRHEDDYDTDIFRGEGFGMDIFDMSIVFHSAFLFLVGEFALFHDGVSFDFFEAFSDKS